MTRMGTERPAKQYSHSPRKVKVNTSLAPESEPGLEEDEYYYGRCLGPLN